MSNLLADLRYGFRMLVKHPGVTAAAVLSLSIGLGANTLTPPFPKRSLSPL